MSTLKYAVLIDTFCDGITIGFFVTDEVGRHPQLFDTSQEAEAENEREMRDWLSSPDHDDESEDDWEYFVAPVLQYKDGRIVHAYTKKQLWGEQLTIK